MAQIGDILAKLGRRETLTTTEQQAIRLWGNQSENNNAFIVGIQNGMSSIDVSDVRAQRVFVGKEQFSGRAGKFIDYSKDIQNATTEKAEFFADYNDGFGLSDYGTDGYKEVVVPETGVYSVGFVVLWESNSSGLRYAAILVNGMQLDTVIQERRPAHADYGTQSCIAENNYTKGDKLTLNLYQSSGSTIWAYSALFARKIR